MPPAPPILPPVLLPSRSLWPADAPIEAPANAAAAELTQPEVTLPWAQSAAAQAAPKGPEPAEGAGHANPGVAGAGASSARPYSLDAHLSLAVALDVLATKVAPLLPEQDVLSGITDALLSLRQSRPSVDGWDADDAAQVGAQLRELALGPVGEARAALAGPLSACTPALGDAASAVAGVTQACTQLVQGAQEIIALAVLALEAKTRQEQRRGP